VLRFKEHRNEHQVCPLELSLWIDWMVYAQRSGHLAAVTWMRPMVTAQAGQESVITQS
jgi:hypothetical protein